MQIEFIDVDQGPVWLQPGVFEDCVDHYRRDLPVHMTGGRVIRSVQTTIDGEDTILDLSNERELERAISASLLVVRGLGESNIVLARDVLCSDPFARFIAALESGGACMLTDWDYNFISRHAETFMLKMARANHYNDGVRRYPGRPELAEYYFEITWAAPIRKLLANRRVVGLFRATKRHIVATPELGKVALAHNDGADVRIAPNAIDPEDFERTTRPTFPVRVGHAGTRHHWADLTALALRALLKCAHKGAKVHFFGASDPLAVPGARHHSGLTGRDFYHEVGILDAAVLPLMENDDNNCKPAQRWFEHSMHATACVVSDLPPYACVEHNVTGLKARTAEEFTKYALMLCTDAGLRKRIGEAAREVVMERHTVTACASQWRAAVA